jgi:UDP-glucose 4-epimerase
MKLLVTGGLGYIGSHTCLELLENGHDIVVIDNLYNANIDTYDIIEKLASKTFSFYKVDASDEVFLDELFSKEHFEGIMHFAGYKAVGESVLEPLKYYENNVLSTIVLAKLAVKYGVKRFVFSSSATVYGNGVAPFKETSPLLETTNPYGETKKMSERILMDTAKANTKLSVTLLRYFNPIGAHSSGKLGEVPVGTPNNLMPYMTQVAKKTRSKLFVYGNDYDTVDGTGVRDYIHVLDLAKGHVLAMTSQKKGISIYNLGTGKGTSVLQLIHAFEQVNHINIAYEIVNRREGDIAISYAITDLAYEELNFKATLTIEEMVRDAWHFEQHRKETI